MVVRPQRVKRQQRTTTGKHIPNHHENCPFFRDGFNFLKDPFVQMNVDHNVWVCYFEQK